MALVRPFRHVPRIVRAILRSFCSDAEGTLNEVVVPQHMPRAWNPISLLFVLSPPWPISSDIK